jgi:hypothetical protein
MSAVLGLSIAKMAICIQKPSIFHGSMAVYWQSNNRNTCIGDSQCDIGTDCYEMYELIMETSPFGYISNLYKYYKSHSSLPISAFVRSDVADIVLSYRLPQ